MNKHEIGKLSAALIESILPGFQAKPPMLFAQPIGHTLRGLYFESHSYEASFSYVWFFFMPLCVPAEHVSFNLGQRIKSPDGDRWDCKAADFVQQLRKAIQSDVLPLLARLQTPLDTANLARVLGNPNDLYARQAIAFSLARAGLAVEAEAELRRLAADADPDVAWQRELIERAGLLMSWLKDDPLRLAEQLFLWEQGTAEKLGVAAYR